MHDQEEASILIVEDEDALRTLLRHKLSQRFQVRTAKNGRAALNEIDEDPPDLIVSDVMMPEMNGFALKETLQENPRTRTIPFIFLTVKSEEKDRERGMRNGADDYITKPFEVSRLLARIQRLLERRNQFQGQLSDQISANFSRRLTPNDLPDIEGYRVFLHRPSQDGSAGYLYDWMNLPQNRYLFSIGAVKGDQVPTDFYTYGFLSYIRAMVRTAEKQCYSPARTLEQVNNWFFQEEALEHLTASLLLIQGNPSSHRFLLANAGDALPAKIGSETCFGAPTGPTLGTDPEGRYQTEELTLSSEEALAAFSKSLCSSSGPMSREVRQAAVDTAGRQALGTDRPPSRFLHHLQTEELGVHNPNDVLIFWLERSPS